MSKKKIAYIVSELNIGGAEKLVEALSLNINKNIFEVSVIALGKKVKSSIEENLKDNNIKIYYCHKSNKDFIKTNIKLYKILNDIKVDIVHVHTSILFITAVPILVNKIEKRLYTIHSEPQYDSPGWKRKVNYLLFKYFNFKPVAISNIIQKKSKEYFNIDNVVEIINGVDISKFSSEIKIEERDKYSIVSVGRFIKIKNQHIIIQAIADLIHEYPELKLHLVGNGPELENNIKLSKELNVDENVIFHGEKKNINEFLEKSSIFILASSYEGVPISIIEAMASGNIVIATKVGGVCNLIRNMYNGILITPNKEDIKNAIKKIINNNELMLELSRNSLLESKRFDISNCVTKYEHLYLE